MKNKEQLARKIEYLRRDLESVIVEGKELTAPEVVKASQSVDKAMVQYYRLMQRNNHTILEKGAE